VNKTDVIAAIAGKSGITQKDASKMLNGFEQVVTEELARGGSVKIMGFGAFDVAERKEREGRNPQTREPMTIPASKAPRFRAGKALKDSVNVKVEKAEKHKKKKAKKA
jgi:DNA-binding protein HU-beta